MPDPPPATRILIVGGAAGPRRRLAEAIAAIPGVGVAGEAAGVAAGADLVRRTRPDLVVVDLGDPGDGTPAVPPATLRELRAATGAAVVAIAPDAGAHDRIAIEALAAGAGDVVRSSMPAPAPPLADRVRRVVGVRLAALDRARRAAARRRVVPPVVPRPVRAPAPGAPALVAIGVSTGGPAALRRIVPALPADLPVPVLVVQHMPAGFTGLFARDLDAASAVRVVEATDGMPCPPGTVVVAAGDRHLAVAGVPGDLRTRLSDGPPEHGCRPAVDLLLRSVARVAGHRALVAVLTGMGSDGAAGALELARRGARVLAQDEATSVVWGMPRATIEAGACHEVLPVDAMAGAIVRATTGRVAA